MLKKLTGAILLILLTTSCADTFDSVKRGLTGAKSNSADEFLVKKKDPLIMPPDYEDLPAPDENAISTDEISIFEETEETIEGLSSGSSSSSDVENSIIKKNSKKINV
mgnify:CR=1 FL=1